jgi:2-dehydropantoate 2-reductase
MQQHGLRVRSLHGDFSVIPEIVAAEASAIGPVDYALVAVKHYDLAPALEQLPPLLGAATTVVPLLNGIDAHEVLASAVGAERVIGGSCSIVSRLAGPGEVIQESRVRRVVIGELDGSITDRVAYLRAAWEDAGAEAIVSPQILSDLWAKFVFIASFGGLTALASAQAGQILAEPAMRQVFLRAMREVVAVADARGIPLPEDLIARHLDLVGTLEPTGTSSMQRDVAAGKPFELEALSGTVVRQARPLNVDVPIHQAIYTLLRPRLDGAVRARRASYV